MTERRLPGGRSFGAVRVGDEVRRPTQPWTATMHLVIRQFADGGEPTFERMLPWAADLERSGNEVAALPDEFWQGPGR
jgi:hypothetical protein